MPSANIVYFAGPIRGDRAAALAMREMVSHVQRLGLRVLTEHVVSDHPVERMPANEIEKRDIDWLNQATHVIAEISGASTGVGREIEYARLKHHFGKVPARILCLYQKEREFFASPMIRGMTPERYPNVTIASYQAIDEAKKIIDTFLGLGAPLELLKP